LHDRAGFAVMAGPQLANCAPALATIVCVATFVIGPITLTVYKYAAFLFLITLHTIILCQCGPCARHEILLPFLHRSGASRGTGPCSMVVWISCVGRQ
jgi:hypothetical protein